MTSLISAADAAYPFDYTQLPAGVSVVLGYVGMSGSTPHVWSTSEVDAVRAAGYTWCPIVVPPQRGLSTADGDTIADVMIRALPQYQYPLGGPVFVDIERGSYDADPAGAADAVTRWRARMDAAGYPAAYAYWPKITGYTWLPKWVARRPRRLPAGVIGQQWAGGVDGDRFDLSIFTPAVFAGLDVNPQGGPVSLDKAAQQFIVTQLDQVQQHLADMIQALHTGKGGKYTWDVNLAAVLRAVESAIPATPAGPLTDQQVAALAGSLAANLNRTLPEAVVKALAVQLSN